MENIPFQHKQSSLTNPATARGPKNYSDWEINESHIYKLSLLYPSNLVIIALGRFIAACLSVSQSLTPYLPTSYLIQEIK